ncbi:autotransporter outer membrane beta-barrel domain-containing protein [Methylotenera sp. 1P/1]|uniref:autotransporter family protein n=1 Tax=Methylotenera sp. 1P/1 TaxID=1131551 RepID=UPI00037D228F|nr:autotransporter outer membrane beta-barrel domain-containing protein [Methylotenera sp. 1P/1]
MNHTQMFEQKRLLTHVLLALTVMIPSMPVMAACVDNGDGTYTCSGTSTVTDGLSLGSFIIDNTAAPATFTNVTTDPNFTISPVVLDPDYGYVVTPGEYGSILRNTATTVGVLSTVEANGPNAVVINNVAGNIEMIGDPARAFTGNWSNDANGLLYSDGVLAGYIAAVRAGASVSSLTVNNQYVDDGVSYPNRYAYSGLDSVISATGPYAAAILSNSALLTVNNTSYIGHPAYGGGNIISYAGATYTPPAVQDGTQQATNVTAGTTIINNISLRSVTNPKNLGAANLGSIGDIYVVDRNPMTAAALEQDPSLALAINPDEVGPRNSVINNIGLALERIPNTAEGEFAQFGGIYINNIYLGSGNHEVNNVNAYINNIYVDQTDSEVVSVVGGVPTTLYRVHGDRVFTLNYLHEPAAIGTARLGSVVVNDVVGAVNTFNIVTTDANFNTNIQTNGLGTNTLNYTCIAQYRCNNWQINFTGMTAFNTFGQKTLRLERDVTVSGDMTINSPVILYATNAYTPPINITINAANVVVSSSGTLMADPGNSDVPEASGLVGNQAIGDIVGNLINSGTLNLGNAILDVSGDTTMNANSVLLLSVGPRGAGLINSTGATNFDSNSLLIPASKVGTRVLDGNEYVIATNVNGLPMLQNGDGFLQWMLREDAGNLIMTADVAVPDFLRPLVTEGAANAVDAFFSYTGDNKQAVKLQADLAFVKGIDVIRSAERLRPEVNDGSIRMVLGNTDKLFNMTTARMVDGYLTQHYASRVPVRLAKAQTNSATDATEGGASPANLGIWVQGFGDRGVQQRMDLGDGYEFSSVGFSAGIDRDVEVVGTDMRLGFAAGYARSNIVNTGHTVNNRIDGNSYLVAAYGSKATEDFYLNAALGVGRNTYESRRQLFEFSSVGERGGWQLSGRVDAGMPMAFSDDVTFIPMAALDYSFVREDSYKENTTVSRPLTYRAPGSPYDSGVTENGMQVFQNVPAPTNLEVESRNFKSYRGGLGGKLVYAMQEPTWGAELELHGMYRHEFGDIAPATQARFVVGGNSFVSPAIQPVRDDFVFGGSIRLSSDDENDQITFFTSYDANMREKYFGQAVSLSLRYDFDKAGEYKQKAKLKLAEMMAKRGGPSAEVMKSIQESRAAQSESMGVVVDPQKAKEIQAIDTAINNWASALSNKNTDIYFNTYAANFISQEGSSRQQWERKRRVEISKASNTAIQLSDLTIEAEGPQALAVFIETIHDGQHKVATEKILEMENKNGRWLIVSEDSAAHE